MSALPNTSVWVPFIVQRESSSTAVQNEKQRTMKQVSYKEKRSITLQEHIVKYNVIEELAKAATWSTLGQLVRENADDVKKDTKRISKGRGTWGVNGAHMSRTAKILNVVPVRVYR